MQPKTKMKITFLILSLLLTQVVAKAQYDSTSLQSTTNWIVNMLTHQQEIKQNTGHTHTDVQIKASFDNQTKKLVIEERFYSDPEHISYTKTTLPLLLLNEKYDGSIAAYTSLTMDSLAAHGQAAIELKTLNGKPVIIHIWTCAEYGCEEIKKLSSYSITLCSEQLKKDRLLTNKLMKALKNAITLAKQDKHH